MMRLDISTIAAAGALLLSGCIMEPHTGIPCDKVRTTQPGDGSVSLNISMPGPVVRSMTRAMLSDFDTIDNLNILIATGSDDDDVISYIFYLPEMTQAGVEASIPRPEWVKYTGSGTSFGIHFEKEWFEYFALDPAECAFFLLANWGNNIARDEYDRINVDDTVKKLREVKVERRDYAMFGRSEDLGTGHSHDDGIYGRSLKVELKRMVAMFTVAVDGDDLSDDVELIISSISLHNVPSWGTLEADNVLTGPDRFTPQEGAISATSGVGVDVSGWPIFTEGVSFGKHYTDWNNVGTEPDIDWADASVQPMFMFENYHGADFGENITEAQQAYKRPAAAIVGAGAYSATPTRGEIAAVTAACSYIQVRANYRNTARGDYGTVTYRMFLGGDTFKDFDVIRNTYYRITLDLNDEAILEGSYSWRVNTNLSQFEIIGESDIVLNGGGEMVLIQVPDYGANNDNAQYRVELDGANPWATNGGQPFVWLRMETVWKTLQAATVKDKMPSIGADPYIYQFWFLVEPMIPGVTWNGPGHVRQVRFRIIPETAGANQGTEWITITQYEPITVTIDNDSPEHIRDFVTNELTGWSIPQTFYIDRMDRGGPWGFDGEALTNHGSGLANGAALLAMNRAEDYMPTGDGVSAMMHAAFMPYYQRRYPTDNPVLPYGQNITIANLRGGFNSPAGYPRQFFIPSVDEWRLIDLLFEADFEVEDPAVSPIIWNNYWTSDAVPGPNNSDSYVYRMGHPEEEIQDKEAFRRTSSVPYRMLYFPPAAP